MSADAANLAASHYVYCRSADCPGCLPTEEEMRGWHALQLWGEMLARCIAQTPETKTREGALAAILADDEHYRAVSTAKRREDGWTSPGGAPGRVVASPPAAPAAPSETV